MSLTTQHEELVGSGQAGAYSNSDFSERLDGVARELRQSLQRANDALVFERLSLGKAYVEGRVWVAVEFRAHPWCEAYGGARLFAVWHNKGNTIYTAPSGASIGVEKFQGIDSHHGVRSDQKVMLVGDIELVEGIEITPVVLEGLYYVENELLDGSARGAITQGMSLEGTLRTLPVFVEREDCIPIDCAAVGLDKGAICMIQGAPEIVDRISCDRGSVFRNAPSQTALFPSV